MEPSEYVIDIKDYYKPHLTVYLAMSVAYLYHHLDVERAKAALCLNEHKGMEIDAYNLHDLCANFDLVKMMNQVSVFDADVAKGKFHPAHLADYFRRGL